MSKYNDPLESAKLSSDSPAKKGKKSYGKKEEPKKATPPPPPLSTPPAPKVEELPAAPAKTVSKFKVVADCTFSSGGHICKLNAGSVISSQHYGGMAGIERLRNAGVKLEKLEG